jgi:hypothetical protein
LKPGIYLVGPFLVAPLSIHVAHNTLTLAAIR